MLEYRVLAFPQSYHNHKDDYMRFAMTECLIVETVMPYKESSVLRVTPKLEHTSAALLRLRNAMVWLGLACII